MSELSIQGLGQSTGAGSSGAIPSGRVDGSVRPGVRPARAVEVPVRRDADRVEVSREAREAGPRSDVVRRDLVDRVRREIAAGTYETDEKLNLAVDAMIVKSLDVQA